MKLHHWLSGLLLLIANFEESFLAVPKEALIYTMKDDQKYFPLLDGSGQLKSRFIFIYQHRK